MNLTAEIISLLTDEAYAVLCQESLQEALAKLSVEKEEILSTRPPFGVLATSQTRLVFQTSLRSALDNEAGLRARLDQLEQIDVWLKAELEQALRSHLPSISGDYRTCLEAAFVVTRWEQAIASLHDISLALARDARGLAAAINPMPTPSAPRPTDALIEQSRLRALANLRITVVAIQSGVADVLEIRDQFKQLCDAEADGLQLPLPPDFRNLAWVDRLAALSGGQATGEAVRCEAEARGFCGDGLKGLLSQSAEVREACLAAGQAILAQHWRQLRAHAQAHFVQERDVDEVIAELSRHRQAAETARRQTSFEAAQVSTWR
ncbi:MAG: hypothetical protein NT173_14035 [Opitutales bacterium]|nr:hypothetical protein [Opitutales bacterium]